MIAPRNEVVMAWVLRALVAVGLFSTFSACEVEVEREDDALELEDEDEDAEALDAEAVAELAARGEEQQLVCYACGCPAGSICNNAGACQATGNACVADCQCSPGRKCVGGQCITPPSACVTDCNCGYGRVCLAGKCTLDFGPFYDCQCDSECAYNEDCVNGMCGP